MTLEDIRKHMLDYMSVYSPTNPDNKYYDEDGYCGDSLWNDIKEFWNDFRTNENGTNDFKYVVSCEWVSDLDLDGGRSYILNRSGVKPLLFDYMYNTLGWKKGHYEQIIFNSTDLSEDLEDMFDDVSVLRDSKIEKILKKEVENVDLCYEFEDKNWSNLVLKFPMGKKDVCDGQDNLIFIGYSRLDNNPIYKINLPKGFEVIKPIENYTEKKQKIYENK